MAGPRRGPALSRRADTCCLEIGLDLRAAVVAAGGMGVWEIADGYWLGSRGRSGSDGGG